MHCETEDDVYRTILHVRISFLFHLFHCKFYFVISDLKNSRRDIVKYYKIVRVPIPDALQGQRALLSRGSHPLGHMRRYVGLHLAPAARHEVAARGRTPFGLAGLRAGQCWVTIGYVLPQGRPRRRHYIARAARVTAVNTTHIWTAASRP